MIEKTDHLEAYPYFIDRGRVFINANRPQWVVIHKTAGGSSLENLFYHFATNSAKVSSTYGLDELGHIAQFVRECDGAGANCCVEPGHAAFVPTNSNLNLRTISIELIDRALDNATPVTEAQMQSCTELVRDICKRWSIPARRGDKSGGIIAHSDIAPISRSLCPGNFSFDDLFRRLGGAMGVPHGWKDDGTRLVAPNGMSVVRGFREFVLNNDWMSENWPLGPEYATPLLEISNPALGHGTQQLFRYSMLGWTLKRGVFREWVGQELQKIRADLEDLREQGITVQRDAMEKAIQVLQSAL